MAELPKLPREGDVVAGRFKIEGVLGEGGMGAVYDATQLNLGRAVALKVLLPELGVREDARLRFEREARVAATLHHTNAVTILDFGEDQGRLFLAMERLRGATLRELIGERRTCGLDCHFAVDIVAQVCSVLVAAHQLALVHRDLKPENIFLEKNEHGDVRVVVVDFGLAFIQNQKGVDRMTRDGVLSGTPEYISPEQVRARQVGSPADIYSLGCVFYEMLTGSTPFRGENVFELISHHVYTTPPKLRELCPTVDLPAAVEALVSEMLEKDPERRPTAQQVLEVLGAVRLDQSSSEPRRGQTSVQGRESRMIPRPSKPVDTPTLDVDDSSQRTDVEVAIVGGLDPEIHTALKVNGIATRTFDASSNDLGQAAALFAPGAPVELLQRLRELPVPLLTDASASDFNRISELLALGISDVVPSPVRGEELARKIWRAIRKSRRQESKE